MIDLILQPLELALRTQGMTNYYPRNRILGQAWPGDGPARKQRLTFLLSRNQRLTWLVNRKEHSRAASPSMDEVEIVSSRTVAKRIAPDSTHLPAAKRIRHGSSIDCSPVRDDNREIQSTSSMTHTSNSAAKMAQLDGILKAGELESRVRMLKQRLSKKKQGFGAKEVDLEQRIVQLESRLDRESKVSGEDEKPSPEQKASSNRIRKLKDDKIESWKTFAAHQCETKKFNSQVRPGKALSGGAPPRSKVEDSKDSRFLEQQQVISTLESETQSLTADCVRYRNSIESLKFQIMGLSKDRVKQQAYLKEECQRNTDPKKQILHLEQQLHACTVMNGSRATDTRDEVIERLEGSTAELQARYDLLSNEFDEANNDIRALTETKLELEEQLSKTEVERHPSKDAYKTEIKILRMHNEELLEEKQAHGKDTKAMRIDIVGIKADLDEQKQLCKDEMLAKQQLQADAQKARKKSQKLDKQASENTRMIKHLSET